MRITAGRTVQMTSTSWESRMSLSVRLAVTMARIVYSTKVLIVKIINRAWS